MELVGADVDDTAGGARIGFEILEKPRRDRGVVTGIAAG